MNWGKGIVLAIVLFIAFIMYFVIKMQMNNNYNFELVTENYYHQEVSFQEKLNAKQNASIYLKEFSIKKRSKGLDIQLPSEIINHSSHVEVFFYRPSNKSLDFRYPVKSSNSIFSILDPRIIPGRWNVEINIINDSIPYLFTKELMY